MSGELVTQAIAISCPHGGVVTASPGGRVASQGSPALASTDAFVVAGCPYVPGGGEPSPCVTVTWQAPAARVLVGGNPALATSSVAICLNAGGVPQGPASLAGPAGRVTVQ